MLPLSTKVQKELLREALEVFDTEQQKFFEKYQKHEISTAQYNNNIDKLVHMYYQWLRDLGVPTDWSTQAGQIAYVQLIRRTQ